MEIRANYVLVGAFTLLVLFSAGLFVLWIGGQDRNTPMTAYEIACNDSVRGLSVGNDVLFSGIKVGKVTDIKISRDTPGQVYIRILIAADTPVREDSTAQLEVRGITGQVGVSISGGSAYSPLMRVPRGHAGVIPYAPSPLLNAVTLMPDMLAVSNQVLQQVGQVFSDKNIQALGETLAALARISGAFANRADSISAILLETEKLGGELNTLIAATNEASAALTGAAKQAESTLTAMEPGLRQFSAQGLSDFRMLMLEARNLVHVLTRIGQKLENDPRRFLFGDSVQEYHNR